ncbi:MAG: serine hydrolase [Bryobacteraceae bacterium]
MRRWSTALAAAALAVCLLPAQVPPARQPLSGQIVVDTEHRSWLRRQGGGPFFLAAIGDPEGFLYRGKRKPDGTRDGDQTAIIRRLAAHGGNGVYMLAVRTHGGDARKDAKESPSTYPDTLHNPWNEQDPRKGFNEAILNQWEMWFAEMDQKGIVIYFFFYDDAINVGKQFGWELDAQGRLHPEEKKFVQTLVKRFQHHRNLIWCVMEEAQEIGANWQRHVSAIAEAIRAADDHDHVIASHQLAGNAFFHAADPNIAQFAIQTHASLVNTREAFHDYLVQAWRLADGRYNLNMSEDLMHRQLAEKGDRTAIRQRNWAAAMAGSYVMTLGLDGAATPEEWLADLRRIQLFFESTAFSGMAPADDLKRGDTEYVLADTGAYILYSSNAKATLGARRRDAGIYDLKWFDCVTGRVVEQKALRAADGDHVWSKSAGLGLEAALYATRRGAMISSRSSSSLAAIRATGVGANRVPTAEDSTVRTRVNRRIDIQLRYTDPDGGPGPYTIMLVAQPTQGQLSGAGNDLTYEPGKGFAGTDKFRWKVHDGAGESTVAQVTIEVSPGKSEDYFPPTDAQGGWRTPSSPSETLRLTGMDVAGMEKAFEYIQGSSKHGGLLIARNGWLVYEKYFGRGHRDATPNMASCGKSFTSAAMGILLGERPQLFPDGLDQKVYNDRYLPPGAFPLTDPTKADIKLGQLLAMTSGIRGNSPGYVHGRPTRIDPEGPDGWQACGDGLAFGREGGERNTITLWTKPGEGFSYASSGIHLVSVILRHVTGMELERFVDERLAKPMGWGRWGWGYRRPEFTHTCGGGGIAPRPADMLRFAYLLLKEGRWQDRQLVPAEYVRKCGRPSPYNPHGPYSLQFTVNADGRLAGAPRDTFLKSGSGGHCIYIVPSLDLVMVKLGGRDEQYHPGNTGLAPVPESVFQYNASRENWTRTVDETTAASRALAMIVAAIRTGAVGATGNKR